MRCEIRCYSIYLTYFLFIVDILFSLIFFVMLMFVYLQKLLHNSIIYSYKTNPSFSPCPWNLQSIGYSDFNLYSSKINAHKIVLHNICSFTILNNITKPKGLYQCWAFHTHVAPLYLQIWLIQICLAGVHWLNCSGWRQWSLKFD